MKTFPSIIVSIFHPIPGIKILPVYLNVCLFYFGFLKLLHDFLESQEFIVYVPSFLPFSLNLLIMEALSKLCLPPEDFVYCKLKHALFCFFWLCEDQQSLQQQTKEKNQDNCFSNDDVWMTEPQSAEAAGSISVSDTRPGSGKHLRPLQTKFLPDVQKKIIIKKELTHHTQRKENIWFANSITSKCGSVCLVCSLRNNSTEKETMLTGETKLPSCVCKTNKPRSYLNRAVRGECKCSTDQTTATIVCQAIGSSLIIYSSNGLFDKLLSCLSVAPSSI